MKEKDIRPDDIHEKVQALHKEDVEKIVKLKDNFVSVSCPSCKSTDESFEYEKEEFHFVKCSKCNTVYINPRPTTDMLVDFYANSKSMKYWNDVIFPTTEENRKSKIFKKRADRVIELCNKYDCEFEVLVDVGAGFGTFCEVIKEVNSFKEVIAVEPSTKLANTCMSRGITTYNKPIEEVEIQNADVITSFEVIEHLYNPRDFIKACSKALSKNGLLIITTPNIEGFELSMLKTLSPNVGGPDHLNYFTPESINFLFEDNGLEILEISTPGELDAELVRKKVLSQEIDLSSVPFLKDLLVDKWEEKGDKFQQFLADNGLSSHMWIVAIKR